MADVDLLAIDKGTVTAPAGCGKTHLIALALGRHQGTKPILVLTHTNAGVAALRARLDRAGVAAAKYRLSTIDGWCMRLLTLFPKRGGHDPAILSITHPKSHYPAIRQAAAILLRDGHVNDVLAATYDRLIVDEYQDCSEIQHAIVIMRRLVYGPVSSATLCRRYSDSRAMPLPIGSSMSAPIFPWRPS